MIEQYTSPAVVNNSQEPWLVGEGVSLSGSIAIPSLDFNFVTNAFPGTVTFTRASSATFFNSAGVLTSAAINAPRLDYNPSTLAAQGLLIEEQRTNLIVRSAEFNDAAWQKVNSTISANTAVSPDGTTNADKLEETAVTNFFAVIQNPTAAFSTTYTWSCFAKAAERNQLTLNFSAIANCQANFNLITGGVISQGSAIISASGVSVGNGWFRLSVTFATPSSGSNLLYHVIGPALSGSAIYAGVAGFGILIWGTQLEAGAFSTSYIPTTTTALTRSADVASVNTLSPWYNATEGTLYVEAIVPQLGRSARLCVIDAGSTTNMIDTTVTGANAFAIEALAGGVYGGSSLTENTITANAIQKTAATYSTGSNETACLNGGTVVSANVTLPSVSLTRMRLGIQSNFSATLNGYLRRITYYPRRLSNAELVSITSFGAQQFDPSSLFIGGTVGTWYDPSDPTTLFTTSAGTTPVAMPGGGSAVVVGRMLDKSGNGNHAIAFNDTTARPELSARVNLLTYSEEFENAAWLKITSGTGSIPAVTPNAGIAPDGTNTADLVVFNRGAGNTASDYSWMYQPTGAILTTGSSYRGGIYAKAATSGDVGKTLILRHVAGSDIVITLTLDWQLVSGAQTAAGVSSSLDIINRGGVTTGNSVSVLLWGADLRPANIGSAIPSYQRIADQYTYDSNGFPSYLRFDGVDDSMYTPASINFSGTDKMSVFAGVRKLSDAALSMLTELSTNAGTNFGSFFVAAPRNGATADYGLRSLGTSIQDATSPTSYAAPITNVLTGIADINAPVATLKINGTQVATNTASQGTGNYGTYPLYIGSRNNASLRFNGHLYSLIIAGTQLQSGSIAATEQYVAGKTGVQI